MTVNSASGVVRVIGFDPGTRTAGYGVLDVLTGRVPRLVGSGALRLRGPLPQRLEQLYEGLCEVLSRYRPSVFVVETVFHGKSFDSVLKVGEARGVALLAAALHGLGIQEYSPAEVKKTVTGNGRAAKAQVQRMVARILKMKTVPQPLDVTDALAIAFCYAQRLWRRDHPLPGETPVLSALQEVRRKHAERRSAAKTRLPAVSASKKEKKPPRIRRRKRRDGEEHTEGGEST